MENRIHILNHPVLQHRISLLRNKETTPCDFRRWVAEIAMVIGVEATHDLELAERPIETPIAPTSGPFLVRGVCLVPILRAGLGMVDGLLQLFPEAAVGHIGLCRNEQTLSPEEYYKKLPKGVTGQNVLILDPMLATGGSASAAIDILKKLGVTRIRMLNIVGAPEGIAAITKAHPDVDVYLGTLDERLNENGYIVPGLGDAGDRIFGTN